MNINYLNRIKFFNIEEKLSQETNPGTFKEILDMVYEDKIILLVDNAGNILGISVNTGCENILEDNVAQAIFEKRYCCCPVMPWVLKALECKAVGKVITDVTENSETGEVVITLSNGTTEVLIEGTSETSRNSDFETYATPTSNIRIDPEDLDSHIDVETAIARYLRATYQRYLSKYADPQFIYEYDENENVYVVDDVKWGRRI